MHELSIALSMIEQVEEEAAMRGGGSVEAVHVRLGVLSGVDIEALRFAYEMAREGTQLAAARGNIQAVRPGMRILEVSSKTGQGMDEVAEMIAAHAPIQTDSIARSGVFSHS